MDLKECNLNDPSNYKIRINSKTNKFQEIKVRKLNNPKQTKEFFNDLSFLYNNYYKINNLKSQTFKYENNIKNNSIDANTIKRRKEDKNNNNNNNNNNSAFEINESKNDLTNNKNIFIYNLVESYIKGKSSKPKKNFPILNKALSKIKEFNSMENHHKYIKFFNEELNYNMYISNNIIDLFDQIYKYNSYDKNVNAIASMDCK